MKTKLISYCVVQRAFFCEHPLTKQFFRIIDIYFFKKTLHNHIQIYQKNISHQSLNKHKSPICYPKLLRKVILMATQIMNEYAKTHRDIHPNSFHVHFINEKHERFVPIRIQVTRFNAGLLFLANSFALKLREKKIVVYFYIIICNIM